MLDSAEFDVYSFHRTRYAQTFESGHGLAIKPRKAWVYSRGKFLGFLYCLLLLTEAYARR